MSNQALEKTFKEAYDSHSGGIFRYILFKIDNREKALDLLQETYMKTWLHMSRGEKLQNIRAFLYKVASNLIIDEYRKRGKKDYMTDSLDGMSEGGFEPTIDVDELEIMI